MSTPLRVTQMDVARAAGVTQGVVSSVFSPSLGMTLSDETRNRVLAIATKLGYVPRRSPGAGSGRKTILYVAPKKGKHLERPMVEREYEAFYGALTSSLASAAQDNGLNLAIHNFQDRSKLMERLDDSNISGVAWHGPLDDPSLLHWVAAKLPLVYINQDVKPTCPCDVVSVDQEKNVEIACEHLWDLGHRCIAYYGHDPANPMLAARRAAYRRFVGEKETREFTEFLRLPDPPSIPSGEKASAILDAWQALGGDAPTALVTTTVFLFALKAEARRRGIEIPRDLSLVGIDNTPACEMLHPPLTAMEQHLGEMGPAAVDLLIRRMAESGATMRHVRIIPELVVRESVRDLRVPDGSGAAVPA